MKNMRKMLSMFTKCYLKNKFLFSSDNKSYTKMIEKLISIFIIIIISACYFLYYKPKKQIRTYIRAF